MMTIRRFLALSLAVVRCAVINSPGVSAICARFLDAEDKPLKGFTVKLDSFAP